MFLLLLLLLLRPPTMTLMIHDEDYGNEKEEVTRIVNEFLDFLFTTLINELIVRVNYRLNVCN